MAHELGQLHVDDNGFQQGGSWGQENFKEALDCRTGQPRTFCKMDIVLDGIISLIGPKFNAEVAITCIPMGLVTNGGRRRSHMRCSRVPFGWTLNVVLLSKNALPENSLCTTS